MKEQEGARGSKRGYGAKRGHRLGQYLQDDSLIHQLDPRSKIIACLLLITSVLFSFSGPVIIADLLLLAAAFALARLGPIWIIRRLRRLWYLFFFSFIFQAILTAGEPLFHIWSFTVTREGINMGISTIFRLLILLLSSALLTMTTSPIKLAVGLESLFSPLSRIGVPVHQFAMLISISLRFIPTISEEADMITRAQKSRGAPFHSSNLVVRVKSFAAILIPLLAAALQRANDLADAMESRCYTGGASRIRTENLNMKSRDWRMLSIIITVLLVALIC